MNPSAIFAQTRVAQAAVSRVLTRNSRCVAAIQTSLSRCYSTSTTHSFPAAAQSGSGVYVSPFQDLIESMHRNAPSSIDALANVERAFPDVMKPRKTLKCGIAEDVLRFTTTSYGRLLNAPFVHPNEHRVVLKINTRDLPLSPLEMEILREIVGNRLNDERHELRLTSEQFGSRIENKRHLVSMLDRIVLSCQRLGQEIQKENIEAELNAA